jgi:hypothetical protein
MTKGNLGDRSLSPENTLVKSLVPYSFTCPGVFVKYWLEYYEERLLLPLGRYTMVFFFFVGLIFFDKSESLQQWHCCSEHLDPLHAEMLNFNC